MAYGSLWHKILKSIILNIFRWILNEGAMSYKQSGVDIAAGEALVASIVPSVNETTRDGVLSHLGGFGAFFDPALSGYKNPILVSGTDGVGTKLKVGNIYHLCWLVETALCKGSYYKPLQRAVSPLC